MSIITAQQLQKFYDEYKSVDITFTREVVSSLGFVNELIYLKVMGDQWPCVLYSSSLQGAKVILSLKQEQMEKLRHNHSLAALRYAFRREKSEPLTFFANVRLRGYNKYNSSSPDLYFMNVDFAQRPPDYLIEILGSMLELNSSVQKRKDERIPVNDQTMKKIGFASVNTTAAIDGLDRKALVRDISFGGAKLLVPGVAKFLLQKPITLKLLTADFSKTLEIPGVVVRVDELEGRRDITIAAVSYVQEKVPMDYKVKINDFLQVLRKGGAAQENKSNKANFSIRPRGNPS